MRRPLLPAWAALGVAVAAALPSCASFEDPSTVKDLRVLAVGAEPSEIILDPTAPPPPPPSIPAITLSPLIADPQGGGRAVTVTVTACANAPGAASPPGGSGDPTGFPAGGARTTVGSALCDGAPTAIPIAADVDLGATSAAIPAITAQLDPVWIDEAFQRDVFLGPGGKLHGGFDLGMPVVFQLAVRAGGQTINAIKRVTFWRASLGSDQRANQTPRIPAVTAYAQRDEATAEPIPADVLPLEEGVPLAVPEHGLWIDPAPAEAEPYVTAVLDRVTGEATPLAIPREALHYQFFATAGTFSPFQTSSEPPPGVVVTRVHIESKYNPPPAATRPASATIWIVVRDDRGGASWLTRTLNLAPPP